MAISAFTFADAARDELQLLVALFGMTGAGKSKSALRLAAGMQEYLISLHGATGPIAFIDTENARGKIYAPKPGQLASPPGTFNFKHLRMPPPFSPLRYKEAIEAATMLDPSVLIIDSMSHEWEGAGGVLEYVDEFSGHKGGAWKEPRSALAKRWSVLSQRQFPVIITFRAKEKYKVGKGTMESIGVRAIAEKMLPYDMTFSLLLGDEKPGQISLDRRLSDHIKTYDEAEGVVEDGAMCDEALGARMLAWSLGHDLP